MSNQLIQLLQQNEVNKVILNTLSKHEDTMGVFTTEEQETDIPDVIVNEMNKTVQTMCDVLQHLNATFIEKRITSDSSLNYVKFLCDLLPTYLESPSLDGLAKLSSTEIEALVTATVANTTIEQMREGIAEHQFLNQNTPDKMTISAIRTQIDELDDGTIKDAFTTLLNKQYQIAVSTPASTL